MNGSTKRYSSIEDTFSCSNLNRNDEKKENKWSYNKMLLKYTVAET